MRDCFVYVVEGVGAVKVGVTTDLRARLSQLQTGSPHPLRLAWSLPVDGDAYAVEAEAHRLLDRHRIGGEWFAVAPEVAVAAVSGAAYRLSCPVVRPANPSWLKRIGFVAMIFTPGWTALTANGNMLALPLLFLALVALVVGLQRSRRMSGMGGRSVAVWTTAIALGMPVSALLGLFIGSAHAEDRPEFPSFDSEAYCSKVVALFNDNAVLKDGCRSNESDARSKLERVWTEAPAEIEVQCLKLLGAGSPNNYQGLSGCVSVGVGNYWLNGTVKIAK